MERYCWQQSVRQEERKACASHKAQSHHITGHERDTRSKSQEQAPPCQASQPPISHQDYSVWQWRSCTSWPTLPTALAPDAPGSLSPNCSSQGLCPCFHTPGPKPFTLLYCPHPQGQLRHCLLVSTFQLSQLLLLEHR